ncbi:MAG: response regulator transcription factor [Salibacteraceae bacterium]|nr:response regulator transcription factor [Salibacteraceae bacterium]|tara:strand:+ start:30761 stop:31459 length:699 start_codon:yes stop_codon:yes gene_type:complete
MIEGKSILLVEDDASLGFVIKDNLVDAGAKVTLAKDGLSGFEVFYEGKFDICILDVMLPKKDGFTLANDIRKMNLDIPILFLTAKSMIADKVEGFGAGADDYLTKPFAFEELLARVNAILRRSNRKLIDEVKGKEIFELGNSKFDYRNLKLTTNGSVSELTKKEAELLRLLFIHQNSVLEREVALKLVWGENDYFLGRSMDVFISRLRKYLSPDTSIKIENVHGIGFRLTDS